MRKIQKIVGVLILIFMLGASIGFPAFDNLPTSSVEVGVVATQIFPANYKRKNIIVYNIDAPTIYVDNSEVECSTNSFTLRGGAALKFSTYQGELWGIVDTDTATVKIIHMQY